MKTHTLLDTDAKLNQFAESLKSAGIDTLAMDFEGEFNLHEHGEKLCLIQIFDGKRFFVIDPFAVTGKSLKDFLENRTILKLFFGAGSDVQLVYKERDIILNSVLDLQLLAQTLGRENLGLDNVLSECLQVTADTRKKKFQMYNWTSRPLSPEAMDYALGDVEHLFTLYQWLLNDVKQKDRVESLIRTLILKTPGSLSKGTPAWQKSKDYNDLSAKDRKRFEELVAAREHLAIELNWPPEMVLPRAQLARLASGKITVEGVPQPKRMGDRDYQKLKNLFKR